MHIVPIGNTYVGHNVTHIFHYNLQLLTFDNDGGPVVSMLNFDSDIQVLIPVKCRVAVLNR